MGSCNSYLMEPLLWLPWVLVFSLICLLLVLRREWQYILSFGLFCWCRLLKGGDSVMLPAGANLFAELCCSVVHLYYSP